jgi:acetyltransferase-like isoleucine patch superfamily enzyme
LKNRINRRLRAEWARISSWTLRRKLNSSGKYLFVGKKVTITNPHCITVGNSVVIGNDTTITCDAGGRITFGDSVFIGRGCTIACGDEELVIEAGVGIGAYSSIRNADHGTVAGEYFADSKPAQAPVRIGRNVLIGDRCGVLRGVTIGEGAVISANSLVTGDIPPAAFAMGVPARVMGARKQTNG